ncbi:MAG: hypothetical protein HYT80_11325 [Euryarchaeota archaeon]|nr:hypothetical protein [Euryarchaeota archaeon]
MTRTHAPFWAPSGNARQDPDESLETRDTTAWLFNAVLIVLGTAAAVGWFFQ